MAITIFTNWWRRVWVLLHFFCNFELGNDCLSGDILVTKFNLGSTQGGGKLVNGGTSMTAGVARVDFADRSFTGVTLTARGALIYNTSFSNKAVAVLNFGSDKTATSGTFTIQFPAATSTAAILRISG